MYSVFFKRKTAYEVRIIDWSSDVCSSDLEQQHRGVERDQRQLEQLARAGAAGIAGAEHRIGSEQDREEEAVAHQVQPEAEHRAAAVGVMLLLADVEVRDRGAGRRTDCLGAHIVSALCRALDRKSTH